MNIRNPQRCVGELPVAAMLPTTAAAGGVRGLSRRYLPEAVWLRARNEQLRGEKALMKTTYIRREIFSFPEVCKGRLSSSDQENEKNLLGHRGNQKNGGKPIPTTMVMAT